MRGFLLSVILLAVMALILLSLRPILSNNGSIIGAVSGTPSERQVATTSSNPENPTKLPGGTSAIGAEVTVNTNAADEEYERQVRYYRAINNVPVALYGIALDQDTNTLEHVTVDVQVYSTADTEKVTRLTRETGPDGRFEVNGLIGRSVSIEGFTKDGYEPEPIRYKTLAPQSGSFTDPVVLRMWNTNVHERLIAGDKKFPVVPDGRPYAVDLTKGTIAEGSNGDLVVWLKRPEAAKSREKFSWSCGMTAPTGGLEPENDPGSPMYRAPEALYTNVFDLHLEYNTLATRGMSFDNRFYVNLRGGQEYGRISCDVWTTYNADASLGLIRLSYAINPSGSRLLR